MKIRGDVTQFATLENMQPLLIDAGNNFVNVGIFPVFGATHYRVEILYEATGQWTASDCIPETIGPGGYVYNHVTGLTPLQSNYFAVGVAADHNFQEDPPGP